LRIEHFKSATTGVGLVVMGKIREPFEHAKQVLVPGTAQDLDIAGAALMTTSPSPSRSTTGMSGPIAVANAIRVEVSPVPGAARPSAPMGPNRNCEFDGYRCMRGWTWARSGS
jgi:hypothetical protein